MLSKPQRPAAWPESAACPRSAACPKSRIGPALLLALAAWLSGCGPGVGGTGTGETNGLAYFGATAASVCSADVAVALGCASSAGAGASAPAPAPGTAAAAVDWADSPAAPGVQARSQDSAIELTVPCTGLRFRGQWGELAGQDARFFGSTGPDGVLVPATLQVQVQANGVRVTLRDAAGSVLLGPMLLLPVAAAGVPGTCG